MAEVSIKQFSETLNLSVDKLLSQLEASGVKSKKATDNLSEEEKRTLLTYLKGLHGAADEAPKKVTLRRKQTLNLSTGSGAAKRTVNVEVRKKRTYVKKESEQETVADVTPAEEVTTTPVVDTVVEAKTETVTEAPLETPVEAPVETTVEATTDAPDAPEDAATVEETVDVAAEDKPLEVVEPVVEKASDKKAKKYRKEPREAKEIDKKPPAKKKASLGAENLKRMKKRRGNQPAKKSVVTPSAPNEHGFQKPTEPVIKEVKIPESLKLSELADQMSVKTGEIIKFMMMDLGTMATINQVLDQETAMLIVEEMGHKAIPYNEVTIEDEVVNQEYHGETVTRSPVVTIMGHVDHGKTSLLDYIRQKKVAHGEAGGITQHIGAYHVDTDMGGITFIDTPGHAAFTAMRARGADITDVVVIVVAADDSVMPQTREAIQHAKASGVGVVVAVNKMDKETANMDRVMQAMVAEEVVPEEWGGDVQFVPVSAKTGMGIDALLDAISLQSEMLELEAPIEGHAKGVVIESRLDKGRGPVATVLIQSGTLKKGDIALCGMEYGRVRALINDSGQTVDTAGPSTPVEILGLSSVPVAGDEMITVDNERKAREAASFRQGKFKDLKIARYQKSKLDNMFNKMAEGEVQNVNIVLKADVQGSIQAISDALVTLSTDEIKVVIVSSGVGGISESDANLALASDALIFGFNVRADASAKRLIDSENIGLKYYSIIYEIVDEVKRAIEGKMAPDFREDIVGIADVREVFKAPKIGLIAGCMVTEGKVKRNNSIRVLRDNVVIYEGVLESLRRFKDDVMEVNKGIECGIGVKDYNDVQAGDQIECFERVEVKRTLD